MGYHRKVVVSTRSQGLAGFPVSARPMSDDNDQSDSDSDNDDDERDRLDQLREVKVVLETIRLAAKLVEMLR